MLGSVSHLVIQPAFVSVLNGTTVVVYYITLGLFVMWQLVTNQDRRLVHAGRVRRLRLLLLRPKSEFLAPSSDSKIKKKTV